MKGFQCYWIPFVKNLLQFPGIDLFKLSVFPVKAMVGANDFPNPCSALCQFREFE